MTIQKTSNHGMFLSIEGNRTLNESHIKNLIDSIRVKNLLEQNPIIVNHKYEVIDGQHRLEATTRLGIPVFYVIVAEEGSLDTIHQLNTNVRRWTQQDYLDSYITKGLKDYQMLKDFMKHYQLNFTTAVTLLSNRTKTKDVLDDFRNGKFQIESLERADEEAKNLVALKPYCEDNIWNQRDFVGAIRRVWARINPDIFLERVTKRDEKLRKRISVKAYLRDFEDTFNKGLKVNQIRLY